MGERERASQRDIEARARLADDLVYRVKRRRTNGTMIPRPERLRDPFGPAGQLTPPELAALICRSRGLTDEMAAEVLCKAVQTVKSQLRSARTKLGAKNTTHAVANAIRQGLIE